MPFTPPLLTATVLLREHMAGADPRVQTDGPFLPFGWGAFKAEGDGTLGTSL